MKIAIVTSRLTGGGAERAAGELSKHLDAQGYDVIMVTLHGDITYEYAGKLVNLDLDYRPDNRIWEKLGRLYSRSKTLAKALKSEKPDVVFSFGVTCNLLSLMSKFFGVKAKFAPSTQYPPSLQYLGMNRLFYGFLITRLYNRADQVIALSKGIQQDLNQYFKIPVEDMVVIYNSVDIALAQQKKNEKVKEDLFTKGKPVLVTVGRLIEKKNHALLLKAFKQVIQQEEALLAIVGTGNMEAEEKQMAKDLGIEDHVYFLGWQDNPFKFCHHSSIFVLPSDSEGFGNVIVEAMAVDCPVISTNCPWGPAEIIKDDEFGLLVPVNDPDSMAKAILKFLQDPELLAHYKQKATERAKDFSIQAIGDEYIKVIKQLSGK